MNPLCIDCAHCWRNTDGLFMCGRPTEAAEPLYCFRERGVTPVPGREHCGPRAQFFEPKP